MGFRIWGLGLGVVSSHRVSRIGFRVHDAELPRQAGLYKMFRVQGVSTHTLAQGWHGERRFKVFRVS